MILRPKFPQWRPRSPFDLDPADGFEWVAPEWRPMDVEKLLNTEFRVTRLPDVVSCRCVDTHPQMTITIVKSGADDEC